MRNSILTNSDDILNKLNIEPDTNQSLNRVYHWFGLDISTNETWPKFSNSQSL